MFFADENPIGRRIHLSNGNILVAPPPPLTIVGVSPTVRQISNQEQPDPVVYVPFQVDAGYWAQLIVRPRTDLETVVTAVRREVSKLDPVVPVSNVIHLEDAIAEAGPAGGFHRRLILMLGIFAGVAVVLAAVGIYAVTAYTVAQRTQEIGLRMALGAPVSQVVGLFVGQAMRPLVLGVLLGLGGALRRGTFAPDVAGETRASRSVDAYGRRDTPRADRAGRRNFPVVAGGARRSQYGPSG
jgi:hypothetical protein